MYGERERDLFAYLDISFILYYLWYRRIKLDISNPYDVLKLHHINFQKLNKFVEQFSMMFVN